MLKVFFSLLKRDLLILRKQFLEKSINSFFLIGTNLVIFSYFMPQVGLSDKYGAFLLVGAIASYGLFDIVGKVTDMIADIDSERMISYTLTLPLSSTMVFAYIAVYWAINSSIVTLILFPLGKLIIWNRFDLSSIHYGKLICIFATIQLFFGFFALWLVAIIKKLSAVSIIWVRVINPVFMFGGYFYGWYASYAVSPIFAYISLLNPMVYAMEGMRSACLGSSGFLPFGFSFCALWVFILFFATDSIRRLKRRLDCV